MTMRVRVFLVLIVALAMATVGCGHYTCGAAFGSSTCTPSGGGLGGGTGNAGVLAYPFVINTTKGTIDGYTLTATTFGQTTNYTGPVTPANDMTEGMVVAQNKFLYAVFPTTQQIFGWSIDSAGMLAGITGLPITDTNVSIPSVNYNQTVVITNPAGTLLFISDATSQKILVYQINSSTGALTAAPGYPFSTVAAGLQPQNMGMDGKGLFLYVSELSTIHEGSFVEGYSVAATGALTDLGPFNNGGLFELQGDPTGKYLIGVSGIDFFYTGIDDKTMNVFSISNTGALTQVSSVTTQYAPFNIAVQPASTTGALVYSFSLTDDMINPAPNAIEGYQLDTTTGLLTAVLNSPFNGTNDSRAEWGGFDPSGNYLFFQSNQSFVPYTVSSTGQITQIVPTGLNTGGYWAVADPQ